MSVTVLPVRDIEYYEDRPTRTYVPVAPKTNVTAAPAPAPRDDFEGMHSAKVELLRAPIKHHVSAGPPAQAPARSAAAHPAPGPAPEAAPAAASPAAAEIELPNGRIVRVPPGFASSDLERVLAIASSDDPSTPTP